MCILASIFAVRPFDHSSASAFDLNDLITSVSYQATHQCQQIAYTQQEMSRDVFFCLRSAAVVAEIELGKVGGFTAMLLDADHALAIFTFSYTV
ncbi:hypothetical protein [Chelativorans alearense]|uniref:hypothetical protein n=1 Tax=Chelativorans alearense TaxID=2681495 RepID=UPI001969ACBB|nr:hypothetical protein [Chelativorans alearense]